MLSPLREPVYAASARTLSGSLAEMERIIGETLFSGYVGYNGRAPGSTIKKEEIQESVEKNRSGGDARHTLVAYFEIVELASILCVDRETTNLAIRTFRHTANNTSLRNRNVESLATAAFVSAAERRWNEYQDWLKEKKEPAADEEGDPHTSAQEGETLTTAPREWPTPPRHLSVEEISTAANLDTNEVLRYLKVVNVALRKQRPENSSSITAHMPTFCSRLELPERTRRLAIGIAEMAMQNNICSRRNPPSISAAAIHLACQLDGIRKTQLEICRATPVTDVTLRKVHKELLRDESLVTPAWYKEEKRQQAEATYMEVGRSLTGHARRGALDHSTPSQDDKDTSLGDEKVESAADGTVDLNSKQNISSASLIPPPLPPGFGKGQTRKKRKLNEENAEEPNQPEARPQPPTPDNSSVLAMLNTPAMQALANVFAMMPQLNPPPPPAPPPLPTAPESKATQQVEQSTEKSEIADAMEVRSSTDIGSSDKNEASCSGRKPDAGQSQTVQPTQPLQANGNIMEGMQSMMNMVQAMQALQTLQRQAAEQKGGASAVPLNPLGMMAMAMTQAQNAYAEASKSSAGPPQGQPNQQLDSSQTKTLSGGGCPQTDETHEQNQKK